MVAAMSVVVLWACLQDPAPKPWSLYNKGVKWEKSLEDAQKTAGKSKKLVLYYLNTGDVDKEEAS